MRLEQLALQRRAFIISAALAIVPPAVRVLPASADPAVPTFSLKGVPGLTSMLGADAPPPVDLGVIGRGTNKDKTGRLYKCENGKMGCISTFDDPDAESYIPPWTYQPGYSTQAISANDARREALRAQAGIEANGGAAPAPKPKKGRDEAYAELKAAILANNGVIVEEGDRYVRSEFTDAVTGVVDDVEFLISLDLPICGYRSAARKGGDDKRQRNRIKEIRKSLQASGWKSVGRMLEGV
jgi:hypothetical protein